MIAEFSVYLPEKAHMSSCLADMLLLLDKRGIEYSLGATSTSIRGGALEVFDTLKACRDLFKIGSENLVMNINILEQRREHHSLGESVDTVLEAKQEKIYA